MSIKVYQSWWVNYLHDLLVKDVCRFRNGFAVVHYRCPLLSYFGRSSWFLSPASLIWLAQSRFETRLRHYESILFTSLSRTLSTKHFISSTRTRHPSILFWFLYLHLVSDSTPDEGGLNILLHRKCRWQKAVDSLWAVSTRHFFVKSSATFLTIMVSLHLSSESFSKVAFWKPFALSLT